MHLAIRVAIRVKNIHKEPAAVVRLVAVGAQSHEVQRAVVGFVVVSVVNFSRNAGPEARAARPAAPVLGGRNAILQSRSKTARAARKAHEEKTPESPAHAFFFVFFFLLLQ